MLNKKEYPALNAADIQAVVAGRQLVKADLTGAAFDENVAVNEGGRTLVSYRQLQDVADYRSALQRWFRQIGIGEQLLIAVPHAFLFNRALHLLPAPGSRQRRLYSPASLLAEVEEALEPNTYRVRLTRDLDEGHSYKDISADQVFGASDLIIILERIDLPVWPVSVAQTLSTPQTSRSVRVDFEPPYTRVEADEHLAIQRILVLKLDHLGDLVMGLHALRKLRNDHPNATIDLVVGSWNASMASTLNVADRIIAFDAFPRNSSEEDAYVDGTLGQFREVVNDEYDLAIDLRVDVDTRILLGAVKAKLRAGIGKRSQFAFLDIALPLDDSRNDASRARDDRVEIHAFSCQSSVRKSVFDAYCQGDIVVRDQALFWGPYFQLDPGDYIFDFFLEFPNNKQEGLILLDVAVDYGRRVSELYVSGPSTFHLPFHVSRAGTTFEARILTVDDHPCPDFRFYGGRLIKKGPSNLLHQSEYASLLVELVKLRTLETGVLQNVWP